MRYVWDLQYHDSLAREKRRIYSEELPDVGMLPEGGLQKTRREWDELVPFILLNYRATLHTSTEITPNMLLLGWQTWMLLQGGLRAAYQHTRVGLQQAAEYQRHEYGGKV